MSSLLADIIVQYSLWFIPLCFIGGVLFASLLYFGNKKNKELNPKIKIILFVLRSILSAALLFFLLNPFIKRTIITKEKPIIILAQDNSASLVASKDSSFIRKKYIQQLNGLKNKLEEKYEVINYRFSDKVELSDSFDFSGKETDYSSFFSEIENNYSNRNVGAILFASDGLFNKGSNPLYASGGIFKTPLFVVALGDTAVVKDITIKKIEHNQVAYFGNKFPVEIVVEANKLKGINATLTVSKDGKTLSQQSFPINTNTFQKNISIILDADKSGVQRYSTVFSVLTDDHKEIKKEQAFIVEVIDSREKIAIISTAPHPDVAALKESIDANQNYETETFLLDNFNGSVKPYSLIILNQVFLNSTKGTRILNDLLLHKTPWFLISSAGNDKIPGLTVQALSPKYNDSEPFPAKNFTLFTLSDELKKYIHEFPAVSTVMGNYNLSNSINTLLYQRIGIVETEQPLFVFNSGNEEQKSAVFLGDGLWKWRLRDFADHQNHNLFNELIGKTVQFLSVKADKSFFRVKSKKIYNENQSVEFDAEVYNSSYEPINQPEVTLILTDENNKQFNYTFSKTGTGYHLQIGMLPPGEYKFKASTNNGTKSFEERGSIIINKLVAEKMQLVADHQLLSQLANKSGGKFYYPEQIDKIYKDLLDNKNIKTISYSQRDLKELIDVKALFFILLALLSLEWFIRKYNGLY